MLAVSGSIKAKLHTWSHAPHLDVLHDQAPPCPFCPYLLKKKGMAFLVPTSAFWLTNSAFQCRCQEGGRGSQGARGCLVAGGPGDWAEGAPPD